MRRLMGTSGASLHALKSPSPADLGLWMPGEWEAHQGCFMGWPEKLENWRDNAQPARRAYAAVAAAISEFEPVTMCASADQVEAARSMLPSAVDVAEIPSNDAWFRDMGPLGVVRQNGQREVAGCKFRFNAWGAGNEPMTPLYPSWELDNQVADQILKRERLPGFHTDMVLEGGSIHSDGEGTLLTTEECLLNKNRNPDKSKQEIEEALKQMLGVKKVIWLPTGLYADTDTSGHVDNIACFSKPGTVLLAWTDNAHDPQHAISLANLEVLQNSTDARGRQLEVLKVPQPPALGMTQEEWEGLKPVGGERMREPGVQLAGSYINHYIASDRGIVMPAFNEPEADKRAETTLQKAYPGHKVVPVQTRDILLGGGNIHCVTINIPAGHPFKKSAAMME